MNNKICFYLLLSIVICVGISCSSEYFVKCPDFTIQEKTQKWIRPFDSLNYEIFEDIDHNIDTIWINRLTIQDTCMEITRGLEGVEPCIKQCTKEYVELTSNINKSVIITLKIRGQELIFNEFHPQNIYFRFDVIENYPKKVSSTHCIEFDQHSKHVAETLWIYCCKCPSIDFTEFYGFKISSNLGLVEYTMMGKVWTKK